MSDEAAATSFLTSPLVSRNTDAVRFRVDRELPEHSRLFEDVPRGVRAPLPGVGEVFDWWPWGIEIGFIIGAGPVVMNSEIREWEAEGRISRVRE